MAASSSDCYDCVVIGAGISGIGMGYHLTQRGFSFVVLESRDNIGGTWDLFKFPGIRSDSAMYDFAYSFHPWAKFQVFGSASTIMSYLNEVVDTYHLRQHIRLNCRVTKANFDSLSQRWLVTTNTGETIRARFAITCTGYFRYDGGFVPEIEGMADFEGDIFHSQQWPADYPLKDRRVVVVGSGATAITVVPAIADKRECKSLVMLQRSPTYIAPVPSSTSGYVSRAFLWLFGNGWARIFWFRLLRWGSTLNNWLLWLLCRTFPNFSRRMFNYMMAAELSSKKVREGAMKHFTPRYNPWEQRVCADPDGKFYVAYNEDRFSIVTDHIDRFESQGIRLRSGSLLECDTVMMATGLTLLFGGNVEITVDGERKVPCEEFLYRGMMMSHVPNSFTSVGYTNASWTLRIDLLGNFVCDMLTHMRAKGFGYVCPRPPPNLENTTPVLDLDSSYIKRHIKDMPKQGSEYPWVTPGTFVGDYMDYKTKPLVDSALHFEATRDEDMLSKM